MQDIPRHVDQFWDIVSLIVKTRTAQECQEQHESSKNNKENNTAKTKGERLFVSRVST